MTCQAVPEELAHRLAKLLPASVAVGAAYPSDPGMLCPAERDTISAAIPSRQREFSGGRVAARTALRKLEIRDHALLPGADRAPIWPKGVKGSITHAAGVCLAAVTQDPDLHGLGIDLEEDAPLPADVCDEILLASERGLPARLVFSAKETVFKALYPEIGHVFGFDAVQIMLGDGVFHAHVQYPLGNRSAGTRLTGRFSRPDGLILTAMVV